MTKPFYITTPIFYTNGKPHIGHAYTSVAADVLARFKLLDGYDVFFVTGTDEHGQKVESAAKAQNISPQIYCDDISSLFLLQAAGLNLSHDDFIRTTEPRHHFAARSLWIRAEQNGFIYKGNYEGWYAKKDEAFYNEEELIKNGQGFISKETGAPVEWVSEPSYYFALSEFQDKILNVLENNPTLIRPESKRNEMLSFVRSGLKDISISRSTFSWGIPVPGDPDHVMYVWFDALANYLTAVGFPDDSHLRADAWPPDVQIVGKEIIKFHAVYWLGFLMAVDLPLPKKIFSHGHWTIEGKKMSKSDGNALSIDDILMPYEKTDDGIISPFSIDALRYFLMREVPFGGDGNFSQISFLNRYNSDLVNDLGNLAQRVLSFVHNKTDGVIITPEDFTTDDYELVILVNGVIRNVKEHMENLAFSEALVEIWRIVSFTNAYFVRNEPWKLVKTDASRTKDVLYMSMYALRAIAILAYPFMSFTMDVLLHQLGVSSNDFVLADFYSHVIVIKDLPEPFPIFPRL